jgi:hypothetical protein
MFERLPDAPLALCQVSLRIGALATGRLEEMISLAEAARGLG